jgi:hypothetical protein
MEYRQSWADYTPKHRISDYLRLKAIITPGDHRAEIRARVPWKPTVNIDGGIEAWATLTVTYGRDLPEKEILAQIDALLYSLHLQVLFKTGTIDRDAQALTELIKGTEHSAPSITSTSEDILNTLNRVRTSVGSDLNISVLKLQFLPEHQPWK